MNRARPASRAALYAAAISFAFAGSTSLLFAQTNSTNIAGIDNVLGVTASNSAIVGGAANTMGATNSAMVGSANANIPAGVRNSFVGGGNFGAIGTGSHLAVLISGFRNTITNNSPRSVILGGQTNFIASPSSTITGGENNLIGSNSLGGFVGGGQFNEVSAPGGVVPGGFANEASGTNSFASGTRAVASHAYSFVWGGSPDVDTTSSAVGSFTVRAPGGAKFLSSTDNSTGPVLPANAAAWSAVSDSNLKTGISVVNHRETLAKLSELPITEWSYRHDPSRRYIGPMAQDFHAIFGLGHDDRHISTLDTDGVALSALKGVVEELREQDRIMAEREAQIRALEGALDEIRKHLQDDTRTGSF